MVCWNTLHFCDRDEKVGIYAIDNFEKSITGMLIAVNHKYLSQIVRAGLHNRCWIGCDVAAVKVAHVRSELMEVTL